MVDFKKLLKISNASGEIVAKEHPEYDQHVSHAFQLGFQGGYYFAEKYPDYDNDNLDKVAEKRMKQANPYFEEDEKEAYILGYKRAFLYVIINEYVNELQKAKQSTPECMKQSTHVTWQEADLSQIYAQAGQDPSDPIYQSTTKAAKSAIFERLEQPTLHGRLTDIQILVLDDYKKLFPDIPEKEVFNSLLKGMQKDFDKNMIGEASVDDLKKELKDLVSGQRRETVMELKI